jgi:hypothetical protein
VHGGHHGAVRVDHLSEGAEQHGGLVQGHAGGGLVHEQQLGAVHHLLGDGQALVFALVQELHLLVRHTVYQRNGKTSALTTVTESKVSGTDVTWGQTRWTKEVRHCAYSARCRLAMVVVTFSSTTDRPRLL